MYYQTSIISHTKCQHFNVSHLILQLSLPNPLKPGQEWRCNWSSTNLSRTKCIIIFKINGTKWWTRGRNNFNDVIYCYKKYYFLTWWMHKQLVFVNLNDVFSTSMHQFNKSFKSQHLNFIILGQRLCDYLIPNISQSRYLWICINHPWLLTSTRENDCCQSLPCKVIKKITIFVIILYLKLTITVPSNGKALIVAQHHHLVQQKLNIFLQTSTFNDDGHISRDVSNMLILICQGRMDNIH